MTASQIFEAVSPQQTNDMKKLLEDYGELRNHDEALGDYLNELKNLPGDYSAPEGCLLIAYYENKPAGCVAYKKIGEEICEMKRLYVKNEFRGKKIGEELVMELINKARENKYRLMRLDTHPWMSAAQSLYEKFEFKEVERYNNNPTKGIRFFELKL